MAAEENKGEESYCDAGRREPFFHCFHSMRFVVLILTVASLTFCVANPLILNFTVICMDDVVRDFRMQNNSDSKVEVHWLEDSLKRNLLFSAVALGNLIGTIPVPIIIRRLGTRTLFTTYSIISALSTAFFPFAVSHYPYSIVFATRLVQGFAVAFALPACGSVCSTWASLEEIGMYMAVLSMHLQFSSIFTMPVSSLFCVSSFSWRGTFYLQSILTILVTILFHLIYHDYPTIHNLTPYLSIVKTPAIRGILIGCFGCNLGFILLQQFGPIYLNTVLRMEITRTGLASAFPFILSAIVKSIGGPLSDRAICLSQKARVILFACLSQGMLCICYIVMALTRIVWLTQFAYTAAIVFSGINIIGVIRSAQLVARQFMPFVMSIVNVITCVIVLVLPAVVAVIVDSDGSGTWSMTFVGVVVIIVTCNSYFLSVASAEPAEWTRTDFTTNKLLSHKSLVIE